jgi:hypothetical protein
MEHEIDNFIGVFDDVVSTATCEAIIEHYEKMDRLGVTLNRQDHEGARAMEKQTTQCFLGQGLKPKTRLFHTAETIMQQFMHAAWGCYSEYIKKYGILNELAKHEMYTDVKIQKYLPSEGYHVWHCEADRREHGSRIMFALLYLNDVEAGGETEFLYQSKRVQPKAGRLILAPAAFTHAHRGNPPLSGEKYVINSWFDFSR